ncbi:MAG: hypothetical protein ACE5EE_10390 [Fidelibacterota bacterium]
MTEEVEKTVETKDDLPEIPTPPALSPEDIKSAVTEALQQQVPAPEKPETPEFDPESFWLTDPALEDAAQSKSMHEKIDKYVSAKLKPMQDKLNEAYGVINILNERKADNPEIVNAHDKAAELIRSGKINDYKTAIQFVQLQGKSTPKSKPMPPPSAAAPAAPKTGLPAQKQEKRRGMPSVYDIIQNSPAIQEAIRQGNM